MKKYTPVLFATFFGIVFIIASCKKGPVVTIMNTPTISSISPVSGNAGTVVTINGANFSSTATDNTVKFNGVLAVVNSASATALSVTAPATGTTGNITVTTAGGTAGGPVFTYLVVAPPPTITAITPLAGPAGTTVIITGTNFKTNPSDNTVKFNGTVAVVQTASATNLSVLAPSGGTTGVITVTTADGTATGPVFTYSSVADVYVAGQGSSGWGYWKNGVFTAMPSNCVEAWAVCASGSDVYIAGADINTGGPAYWKNGTTVDLPMSPGHNGGRAHAVAVSGTDVYVAGWDFFNGSTPLPRLWKNGVPQTLAFSAGNFGGQPINSAVVYAIALSGSDVYLAGMQISQSGTQVASYWKNGSAFALANSNTNSEARSIAVAGTDIYVCATDENGGAYWKNGIRTALGTPGSFAASPLGIYVNGTDVYVSGAYRNTAKYWKNGNINDLTATAPNPTFGESATGITGKGTDIFISGNASGQGNGYWKNGVFTALPGANIVNGIFVP